MPLVGSMAADEESAGKSRPSIRRWSVGTERRVQVSESLREMFEALPQMMSRRNSGVSHLALEQTLARLGIVILYILERCLSSALDYLSIPSIISIISICYQQCSSTWECVLSFTSVLFVSITLALTFMA